MGTWTSIFLHENIFVKIIRSAKHEKKLRGRKNIEGVGEKRPVQKAYLTVRFHIEPMACHGTNIAAPLL